MFLLALLYEILLDNVFAEVDKREMAAERTGECDENQDPSSWTEVKTNKSQGSYFKGPL